MTKAIDPVCGMTVDTEQASDTAEYGGKTFHFCSPGCGQRFRSDPQRYLAGGGEPSHHVQAPQSPVHEIGVPGSQNATYTCPMHPEVRQQAPGSLPKVRHGVGAGSAHACRGAGRIHLPDASGDYSRGAGSLPHLRDGPGAANRQLWMNQIRNLTT